MRIRRTFLIRPHGVIGGGSFCFRADRRHRIQLCDAGGFPAGAQRRRVRYRLSGPPPLIRFAREALPA